MRRKVTWITVFLLFAVYAQAQESYLVKPDVQGCINVRSNSNPEADVIGCLSANSPVTVLRTRPYWREIDFGQPNPGWIAKKFIIPTPTPPVEPVPDPLPNDMWMTVHFIDVGQGDAIWINTPDDGLDGNGIFEGKNIVIDGGPYYRNNNNPLLEYINTQAHQFAVLDAMIVTHPHSDHYYGSEFLSRHFEIEDYYDPGFPKEGNFKTFIEAFDKPEIHVNNVHRTPGQLPTLNWGDELRAEFLYSWPDDNSDLGNGNTLENNTSMVLKITYGTQSFIFMGDAEGKDRNDSPTPPQYVEKVLIDANADVGSTVLKIAHHGSETSSTTKFIESVNPEYVIVQSGRKCFNGTHIPDMSTLQRYCDHNSAVKIFRTDEGDAGLSTSEAVNGDHVVLRTNGSVIEVLQGVQATCAGLAAQTADQNCT
jgi:competence protein ComEC